MLVGDHMVDWLEVDIVYSFTLEVKKKHLSFLFGK